LNNTGGAAGRQFTLSYQLLPFSGRTLVSSVPQSFPCHPGSEANRWRRGHPQDIHTAATEACAGAVRRGLEQSSRTSVRLPAEEGGDVEMILLIVIMHRRRPAVLI